VTDGQSSLLGEPRELPSASTARLICVPQNFAFFFELFAFPALLSATA
jgi:hypothetical protein